MTTSGRIVSVIAGGWSFGQVDHAKVPGEVIAVNDSMIRLKREPDYVVGMDRLWITNRWAQLISLARPSYLRGDACKGAACFDEPWDQWPWLHKFECNTKEPLMSLDPKVLNGGSSGACAVNLAFTFRPAELYLFGFDMCLSPAGRAHWYPPYPWIIAQKGYKGATGAKRYAEWASVFSSYAQQFKDLGTKVVNVSPNSLIRDFPRVSAKDLGIAI